MSVPKVVLVAHTGPDLDDVKVIMIAAAQHRAGEIEIAGILANGGRHNPETSRQTFSHCTFLRMTFA